ncbi:MAG: phosphoethanolamine transferase [Enterobacteriaceae bacterium]|jgi:glucan phosphoethanolaminetransferase (alkaline phosphatase superfamily)|nr:phosphoethanolamine transferase [Enterobacteriaceae bacterium]
MALFYKNKNTFAFISLWGLLFLLHQCLGYQLKLIYVFSAFALFLFFAALNKRIYILLISFFAIIGILYAPLGLNYGFPDINAVGSVLYTNRNETLEYIGSFPLSTYMTVIVMIILTLWTVKLKVNFSAKGKTWLFCLFFITAFWSPVKGYIKSGFGDNSEILNSSLPEIRFFKDAYQSYSKVMSDNNRFAKVIKSQDDWQPVIKDDKYNTYIMVIGESVRRDFLGAYDFPDKNTPWLDRTNATILTNYISAAPSTQLSLTNSLAVRQKNEINLNNSVITLANKAGFDTYWISNQGMKGGFDSPSAMIGQQAKHITFLKEGSSDDRSYMPDENLLPYIRDALKNETVKQDHKKKLIVIHLMGSHPQACARTNNKYDHYFHSKDISCYVQSIRNTDSLLADIENIAKHNQLNWTMLYFADHGLSFVRKGTDKENLIHTDVNKQNYQVPFIITGYDYNTKNKIDAYRSGLHLLPMLSAWLGIEEPRLSSECDWFSHQQCHNQNTVISFNNKYLDFHQLKDDVIDLKR